jgi:phosphopantothenoylcysteine decarboxylase/phosphopantothenate--cysteine ligase
LISLRKKKVLITAGPTREYWDPVRYLTNASSGAMGLALAQEAAHRGARVTLVMGPGQLTTKNSELRTVVRVVSAWDMYQSVKKHLPGTDIFVGAAAVVDYRPSQPVKRKIKRHDPKMTLKLYGNPDIIAMVGHLKRGRPSLVIGFALETDHVLEHAREKLTRKRMDWIVANDESNMGKAHGAATVLGRWGEKKTLKRMAKPALARKIWETVLHGE